MRKFMLLAGLLAMVLAFAAPAIAQVSQSDEQENSSGDSSQTFTVTGGGDNSSSCQDIQDIGNTGNLSNQNDVLQYNSDGEVEVGNGDFSIKPEQNRGVAKVCDQQVNQASSASG